MTSARNLKSIGAAFAVLAFCFLAGPGRAQDWGAVEAASRQENRVLTYSTLRPDNWKPIIEAFNKLYPWIKVETLRVGSHNEAFERYRAESSSGTRTADILLASSVDRWFDLSEKGELVDFVPRHVSELPAFARSKGYFTFALEPQVFVYNKLLLPQKLWPTGLADLVEKVRANPAVFKGKISSYNPLVSPFAYQIYWSLIRHHAEAFWPAIQTIGPNLRFEQTTGAIVDKVITGEYVLGIYLPETLVPTLDAQRSRILAVTMPDDGTPVSPRSMGVMRKGQSPNAATLLVDFLLSRDGQIAIAKGGTLAYWPGIDRDSGAVSYPTLQQRAKSDRSFAEVSFDPAMETRRAEIGERLRKAFGQ